jgi:hypothetical protein
MRLVDRLALARAFYERMWRHGHMFFSAVPVKVRSKIAPI